MIALLRYLVLKTVRDGSLVIFLATPAVMLSSALIGATLIQGVRYPLYFDTQMSALENARLGASISIVSAIFFATLAAFWTLRPETASRSIGSFVFAARPLTIVFTLTLFATVVGMLSWLPALVVVRAFVSVLPLHLMSLFVKLVVGCMVLSSTGACVLMISTEPATIVGPYILCVLMMALLNDTSTVVQLAAAAILVVISIPLATILLERRCAA